MTRPFYDAVLDMDRSRVPGAIPESTIRQYRKIVFCGITMEQFCCDVLTGEVTFQPVKEG